MGRSRKVRRRAERARVKRPNPIRTWSPAARIGLLAAGIACVFGGVALLVAGGPGTAARLGRVAGIMIVLGVVACLASLLGHL